MCSATVQTPAARVNFTSVQLKATTEKLLLILKKEKRKCQFELQMNRKKLTMKFLIKRKTIFASFQEKKI